MNELGLTHIESLDTEQIYVPDLDVDAALVSTIEAGKKKIRNRRLITLTSSLTGVLVVILALGSLIYDFNAPAQNKNLTAVTTRKVKSSTNVKDKPVVKQDTPVQQSTLPPVQQSVTTQAPKIVPTLIPILQYGDPNLCNISTAPNSDGVTIGSQSSEPWYPKANDTKIILFNSVEIKNIPSNKATNGAYVTLNGGYTKSNSFANITTLGFTYCEPGAKVSIDPLPSGGYLITTVS